MATMMLNSQNWLGLSGRWSPRKVCVAWILTLVATLAQAQFAASQASAPTAPTAASGAAAVASGPGAPVPRKWLGVPRVYGRITAKGLGVVINTDDPYSVQVGEYYVKARGIRAENVLRVKLPIRSTLSVTEFTALSRQVDQFFADRVQGLALVWRQPFAVECNAITGALTMGYDPKLCRETGAPSRPTTYFASASSAPWKDHHMRLSMLLAAKDADGARALVDRGVKSDGTLGLRGAPPVNVHFVTTSDGLRSQRQLLFPPEGPVKGQGLNIHLDKTDALKQADRVLMYLTGRTHVDSLDTVDFVPGALADHLTSFGGILDKSHDQMTVLSWIEAGATASYGTTSEPYSHLAKFPHPQLLLMFYVQGASALEAYWKSVAWPQQGLFVGEPLAAPFARDAR
jgi:uncharacterized protein (TIGR03790 family)